MGSRGSGSGRGGGTIQSFQDGATTIDLSESPLKYGKFAAMSDAQRKAIDQYEKKRSGAKIEFAQGYDADGNPVDKESRGGKGRTKLTNAQANAEVFTHNHPREEGRLGGTFSIADLNTFTDFGARTMRASAKEGTYSISKTSRYDGRGAMKYFRDSHAAIAKQADQRRTQIDKNFRAGRITATVAHNQMTAVGNSMLVALHNAYAAGARQYGYTYTLERRT